MHFRTLIFLWHLLSTSNVHSSTAFIGLYQRRKLNFNIKSRISLFVGATRIVYNLTEEEEFQYLVFRSTINLARIASLVLPAFIVDVLTIC